VASRAGVDDGGARSARDVGCRARGALGDERGVGTTHSRAATVTVPSGRHAGRGGRAERPISMYDEKVDVHVVSGAYVLPTDLKWTRTLPPTPRCSSTARLDRSSTADHRRTSGRLGRGLRLNALKLRITDPPPPTGVLAGPVSTRGVTRYRGGRPRVCASHGVSPRDWSCRDGKLT
jgi:hypothetical protein